MERKILLFGCLVALMCSCDEDAVVLQPEKAISGYLPLAKGNWWEFKRLGIRRDVIVHREVLGMENLNGHDYYILESRELLSVARTDTVYYRVESNGDVYTYQKSMPGEELRYKLFGDDGDFWSYPTWEHYVMDVMLDVGTVNTQQRTVEKCKNYYYDVKRTADEEQIRTLAPGIGFIREQSVVWGLGLILTKASIGGTVTVY